MTLLNLKMAAREAALKLRETNSLKLEYKEALNVENYKLASLLYTKLQLAYSEYETNYNMVSDLIFSRQIDLTMGDMENIFSVIANTEDTKLTLGDKITLHWATRKVV